jgi:hypothetical protein
MKVKVYLPLTLYKQTGYSTFVHKNIFYQFGGLHATDTLSHLPPQLANLFPFFNLPKGNALTKDNLN